MEFVAILFNIACVVLLAGILIFWIAAPLIASPYTPSSNADMIKLFDLADLDTNDRFVDLGSGDGRAVLAASRVCKEAVGIEVNPFLNLFARFMAIISANGKLQFKNKSFWHENLGNYDVVYMYLLPTDLKRLGDKLKRECKPGTRIVTNRFAIPGWAAKTIEADRYYLYTV